VDVLTGDELLQRQPGEALVHPVVARRVGEALLGPVRRRVGAGRHQPAAVLLRRLVRAAAQPHQVGPHLGQRAADRGGDLQLAGADLALRLRSEQVHAVGTTSGASASAKVVASTRWNSSSTPSVAPTSIMRDILHWPGVRQASAEVVSRYCRSDSGMNTARISGHPESV
jgi:hypothetical protein